MRQRIFSLYTSRVSRSIRNSVKWCLIRQFTRTLFQTALSLKECEVHEVMESHMWCDTYPRMLKVTNMVRECPSLVWIFLVINFRRQNLHKSGTDNSETRSMTVSLWWDDPLGPEKYPFERKEILCNIFTRFQIPKRRISRGSKNQLHSCHPHGQNKLVNARNLGLRIQLLLPGLCTACSQSLSVSSLKWRIRGERVGNNSSLGPRDPKRFNRAEYWGLGTRQQFPLMARPHRDGCFAKETTTLWITGS